MKKNERIREKKIIVKSHDTYMYKQNHEKGILAKCTRILNNSNDGKPLNRFYIIRICIFPLSYYLWRQLCKSSQWNFSFKQQISNEFGKNI